MKTTIALAIVLLIGFSGYSQQKETVFTKVDDMVKVTYFHDNGIVKTEGFFKNKRLTGQWITFDDTGKKVQEAFYEDGKKVGLWKIWIKEGVREIRYVDNKIVSVHLVKPEFELAINK